MSISQSRLEILTMTTKTYNKICEMQKNIPHSFGDIAPEMVELLKNAHTSYYSDLEEAAKFTNLAGDLNDWIEYLQDLTQSLINLHDELLDISCQYGEEIMQDHNEEDYMQAHNASCDYEKYKLSRKYGIINFWDI